jgi:hypothetical protein
MIYNTCAQRFLLPNRFFSCFALASIVLLMFSQPPASAHATGALVRASQARVVPLSSGVSPRLTSNLQLFVNLSPVSPNGASGWYTSWPIQVYTTEADPEANTTIYQSVNGGAFAVYNGQGLSDGIYTLAYYASDTDGNTTPTQTVNVKLDSVPPLTTASVSGNENYDGSYQDSATVTLSATDDASGIAATYYQVNNGPVVPYTGALTESALGTYGITYYSVDVAGNVESSEFISLQIANYPNISSVSINPGDVTGGTSATGTVTLTSSSASDTTVDLDSEDPSAQVPRSMVIAAGATFGTFTVTTSPVTEVAYPNIDAESDENSSTSEVQFEVDPVPVTSISLNPTTVTGGSSSTGTVTLASTALINTVINLSSEGSGVTVPDEVTVEKNSSSATFTVSTTPVGSSEQVDILADDANSFVDTDLTINPLPQPTLTSFTPVLGPVGTKVTINGTNFTGATAVGFNGKEASSFAVVSSTSMTATVPVSATTGKVYVTTPTGTAPSPTNFTVTTLAVTSFSPTVGPPGTTITVTGSGFTGINGASINGVATPYKFVSDSEVTLVVPAFATSGNIQISTPDGSASSSSYFDVTFLSISGIQPSSGPVGSVFEVFGSGFTGITAASVDGIPASFSFIADNVVSVTVHKGAATGPVHILTPNGLAVSPLNFTVTTLAITGFSPAIGPIGTVVTVSGSGFTGVTAASVDGYPAPLTFVNDGELTLTVPASASTGAVHIKTPDGLAASETNFTVTKTAVTSFSPNVGPPGTIITVIGSGFTGMNRASIGGGAVPFTFVSDSEVTLTVTNTAASGNIEITTPGGSASSSSYFDLTFLSITGIDPSAGPVGSVFDVFGSGFTGIAAASVDGVPATFSFIADNVVSVTVPKGAASGAVHILTPNGLAVSPINYNVTTLTLSSFAPTSGPVGSQVTVTGTGFAGVTAASLNGIPAAFTFVSDSEVTLTVPAGATTGPIHIKTSAGLISSTTNFTVSLGITSFTPTSGPVGTVVTVIGSGFTEITAASVDGYPASYTYVNDGEVKLTVPSGASTGVIHIKTPSALASSATSFIVTKLAITGFTPSSGPIGTVVTVKGSDFTGVTAVSIDGYPATFTFVNDSEVTFTVPKGASTGVIHVKTPSGLAVSATNFTLTTSTAIPAPTINPHGGAYLDSQAVTITSSVRGAMIHYTTDGSTPTDSSPLYVKSLPVGTSLTIKAIAAADGYADSAVATARFGVPTEGGMIAVVTNLNDSGPGSFRAAIIMANEVPGSVVTFAPGLKATTSPEIALPVLGPKTTIIWPG